MKLIEKETDIKNAILEYLSLSGIEAWPNDSVGIWDPRKRVYRKKSSRFHMNGVADILGIMPNGKLLAIEVKTRKGVVSPNQKAFLKMIEKNCGLAFVARSLKDAMDIITFELVIAKAPLRQKIIPVPSEVINKMKGRF